MISKCAASGCKVLLLYTSQLVKTGSSVNCSCHFLRLGKLPITRLCGMFLKEGAPTLCPIARPSDAPQVSARNLLGQSRMLPRLPCLEAVCEAEQLEQGFA